MSDIDRAQRLMKTHGFEARKLSEMPDLEFITSGIPEIDALTKFPRARVTEIYGLQGVGKTTLMSRCLASMSQEGKVLYIDVENALNSQRLKAMGADEKNVTITDLHVLEDVAKLTLEAVNDYDIIVIDSVAALIPKSEYDGETGDQHVGLKPRLMGQWMRKLTGPLGKSRCAMVFINQQRMTMEMYGPKKITPGGMALSYAASLRIELSTTKADRIKGKDGNVKGHKVNVEITKSKVCPPHQKTVFKLEY